MKLESTCPKCGTPVSATLKEGYDFTVAKWGCANCKNTWPIIYPEDDSALKTQEGGDHYKGLPIQPIEYIHANSIPFAEGNVIKYVTRWRSKNGIADLKKARHFIDLLIELEEKKNG